MGNFCSIVNATCSYPPPLCINGVLFQPYFTLGGSKRIPFEKTGTNFTGSKLSPSPHQRRQSLSICCSIITSGDFLHRGVPAANDNTARAVLTEVCPLVPQTKFSLSVYTWTSEMKIKWFCAEAAYLNTWTTFFLFPVTVSPSSEPAPTVPQGAETDYV